jgi:predicted component of type VI protein secretion system
MLDTVRPREEPMSKGLMCGPATQLPLGLLEKPSHDRVLFGAGAFCASAGSDISAVQAKTEAAFVA